MGSHSVTCYPTQVNTPHLNPSQTGWYLIYLPQRDGRLSWPSWLDSARAGSRTSQQPPFDHESNAQPLHHQDNFIPIPFETKELYGILEEVAPNKNNKNDKMWWWWLPFCRSLLKRLATAVCRSCVVLLKPVSAGTVNSELAARFFNRNCNNTDTTAVSPYSLQLNNSNTNIETLSLPLVRWSWINSRDHKFTPDLTIFWHRHEFACSHSGQFPDVVHIVCLRTTTSFSAMCWLL